MRNDAMNVGLGDGISVMAGCAVFPKTRVLGTLGIVAQDEILIGAEVGRVVFGAAD